MTIDGETGRNVKRKFAWLLGKNSQARFLVGLYDWVVSQYKEKEFLLPAFSVQHVNEIFMAKDTEDVIRILNMGLEKGFASIHELITIPGLDQDDCLRSHVLETATCYQEFMYEYSRAGFFSALINKFDALRRAYKELLEGYLEKSSESTLGPKLMKGFMLLPQQFTQTGVLGKQRLSDCGSSLHFTPLCCR